MKARFAVSGFLLGFSVLFGFTGCTKVRPAGRSVHVAIWSGYLTPEVAKDFETRSGIKVIVSNFSSNEELLAKLQAGATGYDVIVPSDYMVGAMAKMNLLKPLDRTKLPHSKSLDPKLLKRSFDPENKFSVPFDWGTTGIAINRNLYNFRISGWKDLLEARDLSGKFTLLDDVREALGAALRASGFSINSRNPDELKVAQKLLISARKRVKAFTSEVVPALSNGETAVSQAYGTDALRARKASGGKVDYILPKEGCTLWIDNFAIPATSKRSEEAHVFIDFMLNPTSSVAAVQEIFIAPSNLETRALLPVEFKQNSMLFPSEAALAKCEMIEDLGADLALWDRVWTEVKAAE